jgi:hypothetical protein
LKKVTLLLLFIAIFNVGIPAQIKKHTLNYYSAELTNGCSSFKEKSSSNYSSRISLGLGTVTPLGSGSYSPMLSVNSNIHIYDFIFFNIGSDIYPEPGYSQGFIFAPYAGPNFGINFLDKKFTFFGGAGVYVYAVQTLGSLFFVRCEYNAEKILSIGAELKHANFGDREFNGHSLLLGNIYLAIKL